MKLILASLFLFPLCFYASAQSNFHKLSAGAGYGLTQSFADIDNHDFSTAIYGNVDYFFTPFLSLGTELQKGEIRADASVTDPYGRGFVNSYVMGQLNGKLHLGALIDYGQGSFVNAIKWLYVGGGAGIIHNKMTKIIRIKKNTVHKFPGKDNSYELLMPLDIGFNFYFNDYSGKQRFAINLNLQSNITLGEGLDGYDYSSETFKSGRPDIYNFYSIGMKYQFGPIGFSKKSLY